MNAPMKELQSSTEKRASVADLHDRLAKFGILPLDSTLPGETPIRTLRRSRVAEQDDNIGLATLVEVDGVWHWQQGMATPGIAGRRARRGDFITIFGGSPYTTVKYEKLGINQIAGKLEDFDRGFNEEVARATKNNEKNPGLREFKDGNLIPESTPVQSGRILIFIHGTFSNNDNLFKEMNEIDEGKALLGDLLKQANGKALNYDQILSFDHYTLSRSPVLNALDLARIMSSSNADVDIVCHSRGGLIARWFMEVFDRVPRKRRRVIFVGSPLRGTSLAAPDRVRAGIDLFASIGQTIGTGLSLIPFAEVAGCLMQIAFSVGKIVSKTPLVDASVAMIPGLAAMSRVSNNFELDALRDCPSGSSQYYAITGVFRPKDVGWKFWQAFCDFGPRVAKAADNLVFRDSDGAPCSNDLVVDTKSMTEYGFPATLSSDSVYTFGENDHVYHTIYFRQPGTIQFLRKSLQIG